jgi:hypothetical protein
MQVLLSASPSILQPNEKLTLVWGVTEGWCVTPVCDAFATMFVLCWLCVHS